MTSTYTTPGTLRAGFDYQDIVALDFVVEMLKHLHQNRYQWVSVEREENGSLDDIEAFRGDGTYLLRQVKFSANPDEARDPWTWDDLLKRAKHKKTRKLLPSLLMRWHESIKLLKTRGQPYEAAVVTNRKPSPELASTFQNLDLVDLNKIADAETKQKIIEQFGGDGKQAEDFLPNSISRWINKVWLTGKTQLSYALKS